MKKPLIGICFCAVVLLVLGSLTNAVGCQTAQSNKITMTNDVICGRGQDDGWTFNGTIGNNGIFISPVNVTCSYNHSIIAQVYYRYDGGGDWVLYTEPFTIFSQGRILFVWYWVDYNGTVHDALPMIFGIDYTPPSLTVTTRRIGILTWEITIDANDNLGIDYVEIYRHNLLQVTLNIAPYVWTWTQTFFEKPVIKVVVYDVAGWNASYSETSSTCSYSQQRNQHRTLLYSVLMMFSQMRIQHLLDLRNDYR